MEPSTGKTVSISLSFEKTHMPPFTDILILGNNCPLGMNGVGQCLDLLIPDEFERYEVEEESVCAVIINKAILKRMDSEKVIAVLRKMVFPYMSASEMIKVDFTAKVQYENIILDI